MSDILKCPKCLASVHEKRLMLGWICPNCGAAVRDEPKEKPKKKMLFVDDRTKRIHYAIEEYGKFYDVTIAVCVPEVLRLLSSKDWDIVDLDHDLNGHDFENPDTPTCGMEIVRYIERCGWPQSRKKPIFHIHSSNLFAAYLMDTDLMRMGFAVRYVPIIYKTENIQYDEKGNPI